MLKFFFHKTFGEVNNFFIGKYCIVLIYTSISEFVFHYVYIDARDCRPTSYLVLDLEIGGAELIFDINYCAINIIT